MAKRKKSYKEVTIPKPPPASYPVLPPEQMKEIEKTETRIVFVEAGSPGIKEWTGFINEAYNASLTYPACIPTYQRLRRSMPEIVSIARAFTSWGRHVQLVVDLPDKPTDDDKKYKDFIDSVFDEIEGGTSRLIETILSRVPFDGWGWWECVPGKREKNWDAPYDNWKSEYDDGLTGFRRIAYRDSSSFYQWAFNENQKVVGMVQQAYPRPKVALLSKDSLHLTYGDPNNPEGLSPLEAIWRLERLKYGYEVIMGTGAEHSAGFFSVNKTTEGALSAEDKNNVRAAAKAVLTAQEGNYALFPYGMDGKVIDVPFSAAGSLLEMIKYYSIMTFSTYLMQWIALNTLTGTGALASATDSSDISVFTFNAMLDGFAAQFDDQVGKRLWEWNKDSFPNATKRPKFRFTNIDKKIALSDISSFVSQLSSILPLGDDDLKAIREKSGFLPKNLPKKTKEQIAAEKLAAEQAAGVQPKQTAGGDNSWQYFSQKKNELSEFTFDGYYRQVWNRIKELYSGAIDAGAFIDAMANTIQEQLTKAYRAALKDSNLDPNLIKGDNDFSQALEETILAEYDYVDKLAADVKMAADNDVDVTSFQMRAKMWANRYTESYNTAIAMVASIDGGNLIWNYSAEKEHCPECLSLNGIVARASEWQQLGLNPPTPGQATTCKGFLCGCKLAPTDKRRSPKAFDSILNIITAMNIEA